MRRVRVVREEEVMEITNLCHMVTEVSINQPDSNLTVTFGFERKK